MFCETEHEGKSRVTVSVGKSGALPSLCRNRRQRSTAGGLLRLGSLSIGKKQEENFNRRG
jgi:hypothetical protein